MKNPFFSIILPIYRVEKYLNRCINSILNQKFTDYEIILVDDGSPDNCPQICDEWVTKDSRIKVIHKQNAGLGYARNSGLKIANGKYIWFVDSDDSIEKNSLADIYDNLRKNNFPDIIFFGYKRINNKNRVSFIDKPKKNYYRTNEEIMKDLFVDFIFTDPKSTNNNNLCKSAWCCCIKNEVIKKKNIKFVSERDYISEDYYFWIDNFYKFNSILFVNEVYYLYYQNEDSLSLKFMSDRFERLKEFDVQLEKLIEIHNYPKESRTRIKGLFISNLFGCLKSEIKNRKQIGFRNSYKRFKKICQDIHVYDAVKIYSCKNKGLGWRLFSFCILKKSYFFLYLALLVKNN